MKLVPLADTVVEKRQRSDMNSAKLQELKASIFADGLIHAPVYWWRETDSKWVLSVGERRTRCIETLAKEGHSFHYVDGTQVPVGMIPITPLDSEIDEIKRFEIELNENIYREDLTWQDRCQAIADLHKMRVAANPKQTVTQTGQEIAATAGIGAKPLAPSTSRILVTDSLIIARHLDDPAIAKARSQNEALSLITSKVEAGVKAEIVRRKLEEMKGRGENPTIEIRHGDLTTLLPVLDIPEVDLILCDPPYGIDVNSAGMRARTVHHHNYTDTPDQARALARTILTEGFRLTKSRANIFMFGAIEFFDWWKQTAANMGWVPFGRPLIWIKSESEGMAPWGSSGPRITTEFIFYATKGQRGLNASPIDVFREKRVARTEREHGAEKPVGLLKQLIECATIPGELVLDPCCGSGSTLVACRNTKRLGFGIEKEETYYNIALKNALGDGKEPGNDDLGLGELESLLGD